ncbi:FAR1 DNA binding domain, zinc finger, SWIM-type, MULE transposase domain containing protein [Tanacetum coccineum]
MYSPSAVISYALSSLVLGFDRFALFLSIYAYPDNDIGDKSLEGCEFVSIDQAYAFYKDYGKRVGFDVRKGGHYKPKPGEDPNLKWFLCSKEGKNPEPAADKSKDVIFDVTEITTCEDRLELI